MKISVNIPSYKRPKVETLKYLPFAKVWVDESEYEDYRRENEGAEIISVPSGIQGNVARVRNYILDTEFGRGTDVVVMLDDDLKGIYRWIGEKEMPYKSKLITADEFLETVENYSVMCDDLGYKFWGININSHNKMSYNQTVPFSTKEFIGGPVQCFLNNPLRYDENLPLKEDYDMCIQHCNKYRGVLRVNYMFFVAKQSVQPGGCAMYRNYKNEEAQLAALQRKWGTKIVKESAVKNPRQKRESKIMDYNPSIHIPIKGI